MILADYRVIILLKEREATIHMKIIGRVEEQEKLRMLLNSKKAEFVVVYGRRRIGKTFLIKEFFSCTFYNLYIKLRWNIVRLFRNHINKKSFLYKFVHIRIIVN